MSQTDSTALAVDQEEAEILARFDNAYQENVDTGAEVRISRLALLQSKSPEIEDKKEGYDTGMYVNNFTREILTTTGPAPWLLESGVPANELKAIHYLAFIPVIKLPTEFVKWIKRTERQPGQPPFEFKTLDGSDPRVRAGVWPRRGGTWGTKEDQKGAPPVTDNINYLVLPFDYETKSMINNFMVASFSRTSAKGGVTLTTQLDSIRTVRNLRSFQTVFFLYAKNEPVGTNKVQIMHVAASKSTAKQLCPELYKLAMGMANMLSEPGGVGASRQASILGAAELASDDQHQESSDSNVVDSTAKSPGDDPFPDANF